MCFGDFGGEFATIIRPQGLHFSACEVFLPFLEALEEGVHPDVHPDVVGFVIQQGQKYSAPPRDL